MNVDLLSNLLQLLNFVIISKSIGRTTERAGVICGRYSKWVFVVLEYESYDVVDRVDCFVNLVAFIGIFVPLMKDVDPLFQRFLLFGTFAFLTSQIWLAFFTIFSLLRVYGCRRGRFCAEWPVWLSCSHSRLLRWNHLDFTVLLTSAPNLHDRSRALLGLVKSDLRDISRRVQIVLTSAKSSTLR